MIEINSALIDDLLAKASAECLESGTVILECKDGKYEPLEEEDVRKI